jgi:hypothetical protein
MPQLKSDVKTRYRTVVVRLIILYAVLLSTKREIPSDELQASKSRQNDVFSIVLFLAKQASSYHMFQEEVIIVYKNLPEGYFNTQ